MLSYLLLFSIYLLSLLCFLAMILYSNVHLFSTHLIIWSRSQGLIITKSELRGFILGELRGTHRSEPSQLNLLYMAVSVRQTNKGNRYIWQNLRYMGFAVHRASNIHTIVMFTCHNERLLEWIIFYPKYISSQNMNSQY